MTPTRWILFGFLAAAALSAAFFFYARREPAGRGRRALALLRAAAVILLLLLLFNPTLRAPGIAGGPRRLLILDASASMQAPEGGGVSRWQAALRRARGERRRVLLFGDAPRSVAAESLSSVTPVDAHSRLAPALRAAAEAGAAEVRVVTDGAIEDAADARTVAREAGLRVVMDTVAAVGGEDRGIVELDAPAWAESGKPVTVRVGVGSRSGPGGDTLQLSVRDDDGHALGRARVAVPAAGRVATAEVEFTPRAPSGGGLVRLEASLSPGDAVPADDARHFYVYVAEAPTGVAVVSFRPGQEPRFLVPVLQDALALPVRGFLRVADGRYTRTGSALTAARPADEAEVRKAVQQADLVVFHGFGADAPDWARQEAPRLRRLLLFPEGPLPAGAVPLALPAPSAGEWYVSAPPPASPLSGFLTGLAYDSLPPLLDVRTVGADHPGWAPLEARMERAGPAAPVLLAGGTADRRWAVALASGYWRWAFRGGALRQAYRTLWSALAGWLMREEAGLAARAVRPAEWAVPRGEPIRWTTPGVAADSLRLVVHDSAGATVLDSTVIADAGGVASTPPLAPGRYRYDAAAFARDSALARATGPLTVERYSPDFLRPVAAWGGAVGGGVVGGGVSEGRRPVRTLPWLYAALIVVLCAEWALRRRWGLR